LDAKPEDDIQLSMFVRSVLRAEALSADFNMEFMALNTFESSANIADFARVNYIWEFIHI
jgi:hypothetical protein